MPERYVVAHHPRSPTLSVNQTFQQKGLAFAYVSRRLKTDCNGAIAIERQTCAGGGAWTITDTWQFFQDGRIDHTRS